MTTELIRAAHLAALRDPALPADIDPAPRHVSREYAQRARSERFVSGTHVHGQTVMHYKLYTPPGDVRVARPLLVMLHGGKQGLEDFVLSSQMNEAAGRLGWMVLYPEKPTRNGAAASPPSSPAARAASSRSIGSTNSACTSPVCRRAGPWLRSLARRIRICSPPSAFTRGFHTAPSTTPAARPRSSGMATRISSHASNARPRTALRPPSSFTA